MAAIEKASTEKTTGELARVSTELQAAQQRAAQLEQKNHALEEQGTAAQAKLTTQLEEARTTLSAQLKPLTDANQQLTTQLSAAQARVATVEKASTEKTTGELARVTTELQAAQQRATQLEQQNRELAGQGAAAHATVTTLSKQLEDARATLTAQVEKATSANQQLTAQLAAAQARVAAVGESGKVSQPTWVARLTILSGPSAIKTITIDQAQVSFGRLHENQIAIDSIEVSRNHAVLVREADGYVLCDLESRNGTFVNNQKITKAKLKNGDELGIATFKMRYVWLAENPVQK